MDKLIAVFAVIIGGLLLLLGIACLLALPFMLLWNACLVGAVAGVSAIGFWQALGLLILCGFMFKSTGVSSSK